ADAVVGLGRRLLHLPVGVGVRAVDGGRVVLVVVEVPARDVVDVAVVVVVLAVGEADDQILGVGVAVVVGVRRVGVVLDVEDAIVVVGRGRRKLAGVEVHLVHELARRAVVPIDASLDIGDDGGRVAGREVSPRPVD